MKKYALKNIANFISIPCITISMNTPGCQFDHSQFKIELERLIDQSKFLVLEKYAGTGISIDSLLKRLARLAKEISFDEHLKSLTVFLSGSICEIIPSMWPVAHNKVQVNDRFDIRPLLAIVNNTEEYHVLLLSHKKVRLFYAVNDKVVNEVRNGTFPVTKSLTFLRPHFKCFNTAEETGFNQFLSDIDKALIKLYNATEIRFVVVSSYENFERYMASVIFSSIYLGHVPISNDMSRATIGLASWELMQKFLKQGRCHSVKVMQEMIMQGMALTATDAIVVASRQGKGDVLILNEDIQLPEKEEELISEAVWNVVSKHGKVVLARQDEVESIGSHVLKLKY